MRILEAVHISSYFVLYLENKISYCNHLLKLCDKLSPGKSELRGYLLFNKYCSLKHLLKQESKVCPHIICTVNEQVNWRKKLIKKIYLS